MIVALKSRNSAGNVLCRRLAEGGDPHVAETGLEALGEHAVHLDLLAAQRELEELGAPVAANGQLHHAAGSPAHAGDRAREVRTDVGTVDAHDLVTGAQSRPL